MKALLVVFLSLFSVVVLADDTPAATGGSLSDSIRYFMDWFSEGIYESADTVLERVGAWLIVWYLELKIFWINIAVAIAETFIETLGISDFLNSAFSSLDSALTGLLFHLRIPEAINMIFSARVARMILDLV